MVKINSLNTEEHEICYKIKRNVFRSHNQPVWQDLWFMIVVNLPRNTVTVLGLERRGLDILKQRAQK